MRRVFADSFFYIAALNEEDAAHRRARAFAAAGATQIFTTTAVLLEVADALSAPIFRQTCGRFLATLAAQPRTTIYPLDDILLARGLTLYRERPDKGWSLTDCISFIVMDDEGLTEALTADWHFEQAGFRALLKG